MFLSWGHHKDRIEALLSDQTVVVCRNMKVSECEGVRIWKCQNYSKGDGVRIQSQTIPYSDCSIIWPFHILTIPYSDCSIFWPFQILYVPDSDRSRLCPFQILTVPDSDRSRFWPFQILTPSNLVLKQDSNTFRFWNFQLPPCIC